MTETTHRDSFPADPAVGRTRPADPPRELTSRGNRWAWLEPRVRVWWTSALLLAIIGAYLVIAEVSKSSLDRRLVAGGVRVEAVITDIKVSGGSPGRDRSILPAERAHFSMSFQTASGERLGITESRLKDQREPLREGDSVVIYVDKSRLTNWDPRDTDLWTDRLDSSLREDLFLGLLFMPVVNILLVLAVIQRIRVIRVWKTGEAQMAVVVDLRQTPSAPFSRLVRYALRDVRDRRIFKAIIPTRVAKFQPGDVFWVVARPNRPGLAVVAALYQ